jgi:DNA-binding response OmpR family regulator
VDYIVKPFNGDALVAKVQAFLEKQDLKRRTARRSSTPTAVVHV